MKSFKDLKYYSLIRNIFKFEIFYKTFILFFLSPLLRLILNEYLDWVGYGIAFNQDMLYSFLRWQGVLVFLILFVVMSFIVYYEIYVIIEIIAIFQQNRKYSLRLIILKSFRNLKKVHYPTFLISGLYYVLLLPLVHIGYLNNYIVRWDIPNFVFKELQLTIFGQFLICVIYFAYYAGFIMMVFVPIYMVLKKENIIKATRSSFRLLKQLSMMEKIRLVIIFVVWLSIDLLLDRYLPYSLLNNRDFNFYFLKYLINSSSFRNSFIQYVILFVISLIAEIIVLYRLIKIVYAHNEELTTIDQLQINTKQLNEGIIKVQGLIKTSLIKIKDGIIHLKFYQEYKKVIYFIGISLLIVCLIFYLEQDTYVHRPWVIGHRGCDQAVENTYEAVALATEQGADFAEIDIQLSSDGVPVVFHDSSMSRLSELSVDVSELTADEFESIQLTQDDMTAYPLTLAHLLEKIQENELDIRLLIEFKPTSDNYQEMVDAVIDVVETYQFENEAMYMSSNYDCIQYLNEEEPDYWIGYCIFGSVGDIDAKIWDMNIDFLAMEENRISTSLIQRAVDQMLPVYVWTVDNTKKMQQYLNMGVTGIITNDPDAAKTIVDQYELTDDHYYYFDDQGYDVLE